MIKQVTMAELYEKVRRAAMEEKKLLAELAKKADSEFLKSSFKEVKDFFRGSTGSRPACCRAEILYQSATSVLCTVRRHDSSLPLETAHYVPWNRLKSRPS